MLDDYYFEKFGIVVIDLTVTDYKFCINFISLDFRMTLKMDESQNGG